MIIRGTHILGTPYSSIGLYRGLFHGKLSVDMTMNMHTASIWRFLSHRGTPKSSILIGFFPCKPSILDTPIFRKLLNDLHFVVAGHFGHVHLLHGRRSIFDASCIVRAASSGGQLPSSCARYMVKILRVWAFGTFS